MFDTSIFEHIRKVWIETARFRNSHDMADSAPDVQDLKYLVETIFFTSLEKEEGYQILTRMSFVPETCSDIQPRVDVFPFTEEIELTSKSLAKLSLAFNQQLTSIMVVRKSGKYFISGLLFYGRSVSHLDSIQQWTPPPNLLTLSVRVTGSVIISYGDGVVGRFEKGEFIAAHPGPMASEYFVRHIMAYISKHEANRYKYYWFLYRDCLERLYLTASKEGHGGTIIWCPSDLISNIVKYVQPGISISKSLSGSDIAADYLCLSEQKQVYDSSLIRKKKLCDYLDYVAHLSCIDGALVIDDKLSPHIFNGRIKINNWHGNVFEGTILKQKPCKKIDVSGFGMRHNSAISLIGNCPGVIAFVISEDGPVRTIMKINDAVVIWPDCLNTVFLDN